MAHTATPTKSKSRQPVDSRFPAFQTRHSQVELVAMGARRATIWRARRQTSTIWPRQPHAPLPYVPRP